MAACAASEMISLLQPKTLLCKERIFAIILKIRCNNFMKFYLLHEKNMYAKIISTQGW